MYYSSLRITNIELDYHLHSISNSLAWLSASSSSSLEASSFNYLWLLCTVDTIIKGFFYSMYADPTNPDQACLICHLFFLIWLVYRGIPVSVTEQSMLLLLHYICLLADAMLGDGHVLDSAATALSCVSCSVSTWLELRTWTLNTHSSF